MVNCMVSRYIGAEKISMKKHPDFNEDWLKTKLMDQPTLFGFGDLVLRDRERVQPKTGRLDLLMEDLQSRIRYIIEVQLGWVDADHIIRTILYWNAEQKRYPNSKNIAVLVAEEIESKFLEFIHLMHLSIPVIVLKASALKVGDVVTLHLEEILDHCGLAEDDYIEESEPQPTQSSEPWRAKCSQPVLEFVEKLPNYIPSTKGPVTISYNKCDARICVNGKILTFFFLRPFIDWTRFSFPMTEEMDEMIINLGLKIETTYPDRGIRIGVIKVGDPAYLEKLAPILKLAFEYNSDVSK